MGQNDCIRFSLLSKRFLSRVPCQRPSPDVQLVGFLWHDAPGIHTKISSNISIFIIYSQLDTTFNGVGIHRKTIRPPPRQHSSLDESNPGSTPLHYDVLPRLRYHSFRKEFTRSVWSHVNSINHNFSFLYCCCRSNNLQKKCNHDFEFIIRLPNFLMLHVYCVGVFEQTYWVFCFPHQVTLFPCCKLLFVILASIRIWSLILSTLITFIVDGRLGFLYLWWWKYQILKYHNTKQFGLVTQLTSFLIAST